MWGGSSVYSCIGESKPPGNVKNLGKSCCYQYIKDMTKQEIYIKIGELEKQLTGDSIHDADIKDHLNYLRMLLVGVNF